MPVASQLMVKDESSYATAVTVDRGFEFLTESIEVDPRRVQSVGKRAGQRVARSDRFMVYPGGASGTVEMDVLTKSHGWWLKHALGTVATSTVTDSNYTHTGTIGSLTGDSFTLQVDRQFTPSGTSQAFTYAGCKIAKATWRLATEGLLQAVYEIDAASEATATSLASETSPTSPDVFSWIGASATIGGSAVEIKDFEVSITNPMNVDRRYLRSSAVKKEPLENGMRVVEWSMTADFVDLTQRNRVTSTTAAGALAAIVITCDGPVAHGGTTLPRMAFSIPNARFDVASGGTVTDDEPLMLSLSGVGLFDGTNSALTVTYRTTDATP
jgi:hypothetical protein